MPTSLARGVRVGERYRLERELGPASAGPGDVTWEALDERLDRPVALRIFGPSLDRKTIVKRAGLAASLTHPRVVRVFDTGEDAGRFFTVSELVSGTLQEAHLPLSPDAALQIAIDVAEALAYAHERGVVHGHLHEGNVLVSEGGAKVGDFALSQAGEHAERADDLRAFGALMSRLTRSPVASARLGLDRVIGDLANGVYTSAADALRDLRGLRPPPAEERRRSPRRGWIVLAAAVLIGVIAFGVMQLGERSPKEALIPGGRIEGTSLQIASASDLDPPPGDGREGRRSVPNSIDKDPATFWSTEQYRVSPDFNGNKPGVGLMLDLGRPAEVGQAQILFEMQGCSFELKHSAGPTAPVGEWQDAAQVSGSPVSAPLRFEAVQARYWLVWITRLAPSGGGFRCGIREVDLFAP